MPRDVAVGGRFSIAVGPRLPAEVEEQPDGGLLEGGFGVGAMRGHEALTAFAP